MKSRTESRTPLDCRSTHFAKRRLPRFHSACHSLPRRRTTEWPVCDGCAVRSTTRTSASASSGWSSPRGSAPPHFRPVDRRRAARTLRGLFLSRGSRIAPSRSAASRAYFDALVESAGAAHSSPTPGSEEAALADFQRRGFFLDVAVECALDSLPDPALAIQRAAPQSFAACSVSYKPKSIALLSPPTLPLIPLFRENGWATI